MNAFSIGISALSVGQRALDLIGQNISNAATPGYHRQAVSLISRTVGDKVGAGVDVASITRYDTPPIRYAILRANGDQGDAAVRLEARRLIEANLGSGTGGLGDGLENLFNQIVQLTSRPDDLAARRPVVAAAADLASRFNSVAGEIDRARAELGQEVYRSVTQLNDYANRIAELNIRIANQIQAGDQPNDLIDQRDQIIDQLSNLVDVRTVNQPFGMVNVLASGSAIVVGEFPVQFQVNPTPNGNLQITQAGTSRVVTVSSGKLAGQLREHNVDIPATRARLDGLAGELIRQFNQIQATGLGSAGPLTSATGTIGVANTTQPLATQNLPFAISAGQLTVSVTDTATGNRTNTTLSIDPATQSLQDIATALSGVPGLSASIGSGNVLAITAAPGFAFDFAGRDTNPPSGAAVANSDTAGLLSGLGVNGLYNGITAAGITLRPDIQADAGLLAASRTGLPGDATNLERFAALRDQAIFSGRTLVAEFNDLASSVGSDVNSLSEQQTARAGLVQNLVAQEQAVSGVDVNEELLNLLAFQRMVDGASKYLTAVNDALDSILNIV